MARRVDTLDKALVKRAQFKSELDAVRMPAKKIFKLIDGQMKEVIGADPSYTPEEAKKYNEDFKAFNKKLKEATEKLQKFDNVLERAFAGEGFDKLTNMVGGKDVPDDEKSE